MPQRPLTYFLALGGARVLWVWGEAQKPRIRARSDGVYALRKRTLYGGGVCSRNFDGARTKGGAARRPKL